MSGDVSPEALAANRRLYEMRARLAGDGRRGTADGRQPAAAGLPATGGLHATPPDDSHGQSSPPARHKTAVNRNRPTTCGAGDDETCPVTRVVSHSEKVFPAPRPPQPTQNPDEPAARPPGHSTPSGHPSPAPDGVAPRQPGHPTPAGHPSPAPSPSLASLIDHVGAMPAHLGWGSETLTAHLRKIRDTGYGIWDTSALPVAAVDAGEREGRGAGQENSHASTPLHSSLVTRHSSLKLYPDIALGMLREERTAAGRVWLLLRALDAPGRGMVSLDDARAALTGRDSPLRLCGWRRLRQLLAEGEGVFWARERERVDDGRRATDDGRQTTEDGRRTTDDGRRTTAHCPLPTAHCPLPTAHRLRLFGPARVAAALGVRRLVGRPVGLPLPALLGPIGDARAHLYAAFHSGRARGMTNDELRVTNEEYLNSSLVTRHSSLGMPIARDTLAALSGVCARSQATYERRAGVAARANIALGERVAASCPAGPAEQERAWGHGRALFRLKDYGGRHGHPGAVYLAWRLPNAYGLARGHQTRPKGRQKRINRRLADLFTKGMTGNGAGIEKRFFGTAAAAFKNYELRITNYEWKRRAARRGAAVHPATPVAPLPTTHYPLPTASCRPGDSCRPAAYWPLTTGHSPAGGGWGVWAVADRAVADGAAGGMNPTAASRNLLKQVPGDPARDANRLQPVLIGRGGFESA